jgi:hypothetical protein
MTTAERTNQDCLAEEANSKCGRDQPIKNAKRLCPGKGKYLKRYFLDFSRLLLRYSFMNSSIICAHNFQYCVIKA